MDNEILSRAENNQVRRGRARARSHRARHFESRGPEFSEFNGDVNRVSGLSRVKETRGGESAKRKEVLSLAPRAKTNRVVSVSRTPPPFLFLLFVSPLSSFHRHKATSLHDIRRGSGNKNDKRLLSTTFPRRFKSISVRGNFSMGESLRKERWSKKSSRT